MSISKSDLFNKILETLRETNANPEDAIEVLFRVTGTILDKIVNTHLSVGTGYFSLAD